MSPAVGIAIVAGLILLDQLSKALALGGLPFQQPVEILPFLSLLLTYNTGIAFSLLSSLDGRLLTILTLAILAGMLWLWRQTSRREVAARLGYCFILGGALGNLLDRVRLGHVVDFIWFHLENWSFAVFNLADSFITVGAGLIVLNEIIEFRRRRRQNNGASE